MSQIGQIQTLKVLRLVTVGAYLDGGGELGEILLPNSEKPADLKAGDEIEVFVSFDSEDRLVATSTLPYAAVGEFALLRVAAVEGVGAFLDWGLKKDLLLPFAEQTRTLQVGEDVVVALYLDNTGRIAASMRIERHAKKDAAPFTPGEAVEVLVYGQSDLGYKAIINGSHVGVFFKNEVFREIAYGEFTTAYIKNIRPDGKIDLSLQTPDGKTVVDGLQEEILRQLDAAGGYLPINDKTPAEEIYRLFGASKKKYKIALGGLYKRRALTVTAEGIRKNDSKN